MRTYETTKPIIQRNISNITDKLMERSKNGHGTFTGSIENSNSFQEEFQNIHSGAENSLQDKKYASKISQGTSNHNERRLNEIKSRELGTKISRHSKNVNQGALSISGKKILSSSNGSTNSQVQARKVKQSMAHKVKGSGSDTENNSWWLDLPYVLVRKTCLHIFIYCSFCLQYTSVTLFFIFPRFQMMSYFFQNKIQQKWKKGGCLMKK